MKESQVAGGREYMTYQITKLMLLSIYSMSYAVFGAGNMKINKLWLHPAGKTDLELTIQYFINSVTHIFSYLKCL